MNKKRNTVIKLFKPFLYLIGIKYSLSKIVFILLDQKNSYINGEMKGALF
jgi:hypothetical protein